VTNPEIRAAHASVVDALRRLMDKVAAPDLRDERAGALAEEFCAMSDDGQARFFEEVARIMKTWPAAAAVMQRHYIGRHLATCECVSDPGRDWVLDLAESIKAAKQ